MADQSQQTVQDILNDLPAVQRIALRPFTQNPLMAPLLETLKSLQEIASWSASAQKVPPPPPPAPVEPTPTAPDAPDTEAPATHEIVDGAIVPIEREAG